MSRELLQLLGNAIPSDHSKQVNSNYYIYQISSQHEINVLDLGCGNGNSLPTFLSQNKNTNWFGLRAISFLQKD